LKPNPFLAFSKGKPENQRQWAIILVKIRRFLTRLRQNQYVPPHISFLWRLATAFGNFSRANQGEKVCERRAGPL
jgi:hypothetical protein